MKHIMRSLFIGFVFVFCSAASHAAGPSGHWKGAIELPGNPIESGREWDLTRFDPETPAEVGGFGSLHNGGAQFCMADGAVIFIAESVDPQFFENLGDRADGAMMGEELNQ